MITLHTVTRRADDDGVDASVVERDYVLAHVVAQLSRARMPGEGRLVFKGGTALRFVHVGEYRYSADLDFTVVNGNAKDAIDALSAAVGAAREHAEFPTLEIQTDASSRSRLAYVGPLAAGRARMVKLDFAVDEHIETISKGRMVSALWGDLPEGEPFYVYPLDEIAAEKLRCVIQRVQCRDLYDLYRLTTDLQVELSELTHLFVRKAEAKKIDPASFAKRFEERTEDYRERWEREMREHLSDVPRFEDALRSVRRSLRQSGFV